MSTVNASPAQASNWKQLSYFRVFVGNDASYQNNRYPLLNNQRQQLLVTVRLAAKDANGNHVQIPQSDLDNIRLIDYNTAELIDFNNSFTGEWTSSRLHQGYTWDRGFLDSIRVLRLEQPALFEAVEQRAHVAEALEGKLPEQIKHELENAGFVSVPTAETMEVCPNGYQCVNFYISTGASLLRRFAARVSNADGTVFRSNYGEIGEDLGEGDKLGKFNSSFEIDPLTFPNLQNDNYGDRKSDGSGYLRDTLVSEMTRNGMKYRAYEQHLNIRMPNLRKVPIKSVIHPIGPDPVKGADVIWACRGNVSATRTAHTYMCYPGETHIRMGQPPNFYGWNNNYYWATDLLTMAFENYAPRIVHAREGEVVIGHFLMSQNSYFYDTRSGARETPNKTSMLIKVIDIYGTQHNLRLSFNPDYNYLYLNKA